MPELAPATLAAIIVNYDYAQYVGAAIESALRQTVPFDEILVVDDGSSDDSLAVIRRYEPRIRLLAQANGGQMTASRHGLRESRSEYIYILDADDLACPNFVERVKPLLASRPVKVQCQLAGMTADAAPNGSIFPSWPIGYGAPQMQEDNASLGFYLCPPTSGNVYRRSFLEQLDLASLDGHEPLDGPPALVAPYFGAVISLSEPLARYRVHDKSHSQWGAPSPNVLQREIAWFQERWQDACRLLDREKPPFFEEPAYVWERRLMSAGLEGRSPGWPAVRSFQSRLLRAHIPWKHRGMLFAWALLFLLPLPALRRSLVRSRRSAGSRSAFLRQLLHLLRPRKPAHASSGSSP
jgi:cellulose synthase/poly-beta-1,6-N-acetylglucosamine synthase-like glycosyltransferase